MTLRMIGPLLLAVVTPLAARAELPEVVDATATRQGATWRFDVTLRHPDTGWEHYADGWEIVDADGNTLGHRTLYHPHVEEQPFTRSLDGVALPDGIERVFVRAHCLVYGWTGPVFEIDIDRAD